jgi:hypothetical protein
MFEHISNQEESEIVGIKIESVLSFAQFPRSAPSFVDPDNKELAGRLKILTRQNFAITTDYFYS